MPSSIKITNYDKTLNLNLTGKSNKANQARCLPAIHKLVPSLSQNIITKSYLNEVFYEKSQQDQKLKGKQRTS